ncbi:FAD-binding protein, partial [Nocardioides sp. NPDC057772]|uniref:FAD-binding protein n=1 Tax=Nocardioides sp. NPDC057772 TaxID=3346245 RepID=UPI0036724583
GEGGSMSRPSQEESGVLRTPAFEAGPDRRIRHDHRRRPRRPRRPRTAAFVMEQPDSAAFLIVDSAHIEHPTMPLCPFIDGWETVEEMAAGLGVPYETLNQTLTSYNTHAATGEDPELHKAPEWTEPQDTGPWGAYDLSLGKAMYAGFTMGGLATTVEGEVRREDGSAIAGLYAAGACAANLAQDAKGYASGMQLGDGSYFGRRAGRHAAGR